MDTLFEKLYLDEAYKDIKVNLSPEMKDYIFATAPENKVGKYGEWIADAYGNVGDDGVISLHNIGETEADLYKRLHIFDRFIQGNIKEFDRYSLKGKVDSYTEDKKIKTELKDNPTKHIETIVDNEDVRIDIVKSFYGAKWYDQHIDPNRDSACTWCVGKAENWWNSQSENDKLYFVYIQNKKDVNPHDYFAVRYYPNGQLKDVFNNASPNTNNDTAAKEKAKAIILKYEDAIIEAIDARTEGIHGNLAELALHGTPEERITAAKLLPSVKLKIFLQDEQLWQTQDGNNLVLQTIIARNIDKEGAEKIQQSLAWEFNSRLRVILIKRFNFEGELNSLANIIFTQYDESENSYFFDVGNWGEDPIDRASGGGYGSDYTSWYSLEHHYDGSDFDDSAEETLEAYFATKFDGGHYSKATFDRNQYFINFLLNEIPKTESILGYNVNPNQPDLPGMENYTKNISGAETVTSIINNPDAEVTVAEMKDEIIKILTRPVAEMLYSDIKSNIKERFFDGLGTSFHKWEDIESGHRVYLTADQEERLDDHIREEDSRQSGYNDENYLDYIDTNDFIKAFIYDDINTSDDYIDLLGSAESISEYVYVYYYDNNMEEFGEYTLNNVSDAIKLQISDVVAKYAPELMESSNIEQIQTFESFIKHGK